MKDDKIHLLHILDCAEQIALYTGAGRAEFDRDRKTQDAVLRNLQTLSESISRISDGLRQRHPEVEWRNIAAFRNVVVHDYLGLDLNLIWDVVEKDLPELKAKIAAIVAAMD